MPLNPSQYVITVSENLDSVIQSLIDAKLSWDITTVLTVDPSKPYLHKLTLVIKRVP